MDEVQQCMVLLAFPTDTGNLFILGTMIINCFERIYIGWLIVLD